ncbi:MAG: hypothetical protein DWP97_12175 [Calditrichaeota bacterium]|nr:MAG: hypothetical protein DWP97_12175 [Calditrichota bacterium]
MWSNSRLTVPLPKKPKDYSKEYIVTTGVSYLTPFEKKISALIKYESGYHYDPFSVYDAVTHSSVDRYITGYPNSVESEDINIIDLKLEREFQFNSLTITPFILVKNLLDEEIVTGVYEGSGSPTSTGFLETDAGQQNIWYNDPDYEPRYRFLEQNPRNFAAPRQIFLGLKASF